MSPLRRAVLAAAAVLGFAWLLRAAMEKGAEPERSPAPPPAAGPLPPSVMTAGGPRGPLPPLPIRWTELPPEATGVTFVHTWGGGTMDNLVKASGGGVTLLDHDGDGDLDLLFAQGEVHPVAAPGDPTAAPRGDRLYRNDGGWRFTDVTAEAGLGGPGYGLGAAAADFDGDGDPDLFLVRYGSCRLLRNDGGRFTDVTAAAGIALDGFFAGAAWGDADGDGIPDLAACGYVRYDPAVRPSSAGDPFPGPLAYRGESLRLLLGRADGTFEDATKRAGLWSTEGRGMGVAFSDLRGNGTPVLVVANDAVPNFAYERRGDAWVEVAFPLGLSYSDLGQARSSMGIGVFDGDRDGRPDLFVPDGSGGALYRNLGGAFEDRARAAGVLGATAGRVGWSGTPLDFDLDGWPDLALSTGALHALVPERPLLFRNGGGFTFDDVAEATGFGRISCGRGLAAGDLDGDGDPDVVLATLGSRPLLLRNDGGEARKSLAVRCVGKGRNRDALGAVVEVEADGLVQREEVRTTQGYLAGSGPELLFGLGRAAAADRVRVRFPSGAVRELRDVPAGRVVLREE